MHFYQQKKNNKIRYWPVTYAVVWIRRALRCGGTALQVAPAQQEGRAAPGCLASRSQWRATFSRERSQGSVRACWGRPRCCCSGWHVARCCRSQAANCAAAVISKSATIARMRRLLHDAGVVGLPLLDDATISCNANDKARLETHNV
jgi:hypothetical protein